jgi:hypothetical protein
VNYTGEGWSSSPNSSNRIIALYFVTGESLDYSADRRFPCIPSHRARRQAREIGLTRAFAGCLMQFGTNFGSQGMDILRR